MTTKLIDAFPGWSVGDGFFTMLDSLVSTPWAKDVSNAAYLDWSYIAGRSGDKRIAPIVKRYVDDAGVLDADGRKNVCLIAWSLFSQNWRKQWDTLSVDYNILNNYDMVEKMTDDNTIISYGREVTSNDTASHVKSGTEKTEAAGEDSTSTTGNDTTTTDSTSKNSPDTTTKTSESIYGFNSSDSSNSNDTIVKNSGNDTTTVKTTDVLAHDTTVKNSTSANQTLTHNVTDTDSSTNSSKEGGEDVHSHSYTLTRSGNIGVTSSQQLIESERELWVWNFFNDVVFPDLDSILCLKVY